MTYDPSAYRAGYLPATAYAAPHLSRFTVAHDAETHMLQHASCGLLSTPGVPPTLLALKQHAQSLVYLIAMLAPHGSDTDAVEVLLGRVQADGVDNREETTNEKETETKEKALKSPVVDLFGFQGLGLQRKKRVTFDASASKPKPADSAGSLLRLVAAARDASPSTTASPFDWLDFSRPYTNDADPDHHRPLLDLVNEVHTHDDVRGTTYHCPLSTYTPRTADDDDDDDDDDETKKTVRPYASHHNLLMHANACLERLDHEYAATGGLLSLLPTTGASAADADTNAEAPEDAQMAAARNTLVGQWLVFTQQLVGRLHEVEVDYANAVHALTGAMVVPGVGPSGGDAAASNSSEPPCHWIMANAGDDVWSLVHTRLDKAAAGRRARAVARDLVGANADGAGLYSQTDHLVHVDVMTRFYRAGPIGDAARGPILVSPSMLHVPAARSDGLAEKLVHAPVLSASALEQRYDGKLRAAARIARENTQLTQRLLQRTNVLLLLRREHVRLQKVNAALQAAVDASQASADDASRAKRVRAS